MEPSAPRPMTEDEATAMIEAYDLALQLAPLGSEAHAKITAAREIAARHRGEVIYASVKRERVGCGGDFGFGH